MGITLAHNFINLLKRTEEGRGVAEGRGIGKDGACILFWQ